jgi:hypothetical protein
VTKPWLAVAITTAGCLVASDGNEKPRLAATSSDRPTQAALRFEQNEGQFDVRARYVARARNATVFLTDDGAVLSLHRPGAPDSALEIRVARGKVAPPRATEVLETRTSYFLGNDATRWRSGVPTFARVRYEQVLEGVDLVFHGDRGELEYDLVVAPHADPSGIVMEFSGAQNLSLADDGDLEIGLAQGTLVQHAPHVHQRDHHEHAEDVPARFRLLDGGAVAFEVGA